MKYTANVLNLHQASRLICGVLKSLLHKESIAPFLNTEFIWNMTCIQIAPKMALSTMLLAIWHFLTWLNDLILANTPCLYIFCFCPSHVGSLGLHPSKLVDWSSSGPESNTNGHGPASTLPRMSSHSNYNPEQGNLWDFCFASTSKNDLSWSV